MIGLSKPTVDNAPDTCAYNECARPPTYTVRFRNPDEWLCYCKTHSKRVFGYASAKSRTLLR